MLRRRSAVRVLLQIAKEVLNGCVSETSRLGLRHCATRSTVFRQSFGQHVDQWAVTREKRRGTGPRSTLECEVQAEQRFAGARCAGYETHNFGARRLCV